VSSILNRLSLASNPQSCSESSAAIAGPNQSSLSYQQLGQLAANMQAGLRSFGYGNDSRVALVANDGPLAASAFIVTAASACCAPLNPGYSAKELEFYGTDLNVELFLVDSHNIQKVKPIADSLGAKCIELLSEADLGAGMFRCAEFDPTHDHRYTPPAEESIALLLHTSGTTSKPKIVPLSWQNLSTSAANVATSLELDENDVCLNVMPLFHIHGLVACVLASLHSGGCVYCVEKFVGEQFLNHWLADSGATWYSAVPTIHQALLSVAAEQPIPAHKLRFARSSSASLPPSVLAELTKVLDVPIVEAYGMTEAAHQMASNPLDRNAIKPGSVGLPAGPRIEIMAEAATTLVPQGQTGEVVIAGPNVTPGYLANTAANDAAFTAGWFRTGDQGYLDADGYLFLTGRLKEIVNRGGEKISPREIDEATLALPGVSQAVAFAREHKSLGEDLAMAVILEPDSQLTPVAIREKLFESLAAYKVPSEVVIVDSIPKGPTGKLQRIGLENKLTAALGRDFEAPRSELERIVVSSLVEVLPSTDAIGINDNFFGHGGDSLSGAKATAELQDFIGLDFGPAELFRFPTASLLAERIAARLLSSGADSSLLNALCAHDEHSFAEYLQANE